MPQKQKLSLEEKVEIIRDYLEGTIRACLKIGDVSGSEGFWAAGKQFFRRNPGGFQGKIAPSRGQKTRRLDMLTFFKQALTPLECLQCRRRCRWIFL